MVPGTPVCCLQSILATTNSLHRTFGEYKVHFQVILRSGKENGMLRLRNSTSETAMYLPESFNRKGPSFYFQGKWLFGSWNEALSAAGFIPEKMRSHNFWDAKKVVKAIRGLRSRGQQLNAYYAMKNYPGLFLAGLRYYSEWSKALRAAGISNSSMLKNSTARRNLLKTLQKKTSGKSFAIGRSLKLQAELYFGSL